MRENERQRLRRRERERERERWGGGETDRQADRDRKERGGKEGKRETETLGGGGGETDRQTDRDRGTERTHCIIMENEFMSRVGGIEIASVTSHQCLQMGNKPHIQKRTLQHGRETAKSVSQAITQSDQSIV